MQITLYSARSYEYESFDQVNRQHGHQIAYREELLSADSAGLAKGSEGIYISVNDRADAAAEVRSRSK